MPASAATSLVVSRPSIVVDGQDKPDLAAGLLSLEVAETVHGLYRCEAVFGNWGEVNRAIGFLYFDRALLEFGKRFQVKLGPDTVFDGRVMALEGGFPEGRAPQFAVLAEDRLQDLRMTRRTATFTAATDADVFRQVAQDHGLAPDIDVDGPTHKVLAQVNQSDLAFLRERARAVDAEVWVTDTTLHAQARRRRNGGTIQLGYGAALREFTVLADLAGQRTSVVATGWDPGSKQALRHEADESAVQSELLRDEGGASILRSKLGARTESLAHAVPLDQRAVQARAEAFYRAGARQFVTGHGVAQPDARLRVGSYVDLQGLGDLFNGKYYLAEVQLVFDGVEGLRTLFRAERAGLGRVGGR